MENHQLYHHGIKGMRWGIRRYQNKDGTLTAAGKKRQAKQQAEALEKARAAKAAKKAHEEAKAKALKEGSAADILKYKNELSVEEMKTAYNRLTTEQSLIDLATKNASQVKSGMDKVSSLMDNVDKARQATEKGISAWNTAAKIINSFSSTKLPTIDGNKKKVNSELEQLIKKGKASDIVKQFGDFTVEELKTINNRFSEEDKIRNRAKKDQKKEKEEKDT